MPFIIVIGFYLDSLDLLRLDVMFLYQLHGRVISVMGKPEGAMGLYAYISAFKFFSLSDLIFYGIPSIKI